MGKDFADYQAALDKARELYGKLAAQHGSATESAAALGKDENYARAYGKLGHEIEKMERYSAKYDRDLLEKQLGNVTDATARAREYLSAP